MNEQQLDIACAKPVIDPIKNRAAVSKHYHANLEANRKKKRDYQKKRRAELKVLCAERAPAGARCNQQPDPEPEEYDMGGGPNDYHEPEPEPEPAPHRAFVLPTSDPTLNELIRLFQTDPAIVGKPSTLETYINATKRVFSAGSCTTIKKCLKNPTPLIKKIYKAINPRSKAKKPYAINTNKGTIQSLLIIMDRYLKHLYTDAEFARIKKLIDTQFVILNQQSNDQAAARKETEQVPTFAEYIAETKRIWGEQSLQYLLANISSIATTRDNLGELKIITKKGDDKGLENYIIVPRAGLVTVVLNKYKTSGKYYKITIPFKRQYKEHVVVDKLIREWLKNNNKQPGDFLTHDKSRKLSKIIGDMNRKMGYITVNTFRKMRSSENKDANWETRAELANEMGHSLNVHRRYERDVIIQEVAA